MSPRWIRSYLLSQECEANRGSHQLRQNRPFWMTVIPRCRNFAPPMKAFFLIVVCATLLASLPGPVLGQMTNAATAVTPAPADADVETIVAIRHGEKPPEGLGNLSCRGLNRALALPNVLLSKYGKPEFIFAPNPTEKV